ncbi:MAG: hypothetical protein IKI97_09675 [Clostridia bacterium]|nr:hypothetical protein [Clostridia bacterium]
MDNATENNEKLTFAEKHPRWNMLIGLLLLLAFVAIGIFAIYYIFKYIGIGLSNLVSWLTSLASKMDAVVIVAFITGGVSIIGVIISSIVAKSIDYKKARRTYLAQKREKPYGEFVEMIYKIQQNSKKPNNYTEKEMIADLSRFSREITLWGSSKVANKWVKFRENGANPEAGKENLFIMEDIMNEMRKDLGLKKVKKGNLLAFFVNDIKDAMKGAKK